MTARLFASLTSADQSELGAAAAALLAAGVDGLHFDLADGVFVPDLTFGTRVVHDVQRRVGGLIDVHLMVQDPERWVPALQAPTASRVAFHLEATRYPWRLLALLRRHGFEAGVALNPATPLDALDDLGAAVDFVALLTTEPDEAGEALLPGSIGRVSEARRRLPGRTRLQVDGGVDRQNIGALVRAGAQDLVVGRSIVRQADWDAAVAELRAAAG